MVRAISGYSSAPSSAAVMDIKATVLEVKSDLAAELEFVTQKEDRLQDSFDEHICDDECYDCLDCDYDHFDQFSDHYPSATSTPALTASSTPAGMPSTPLLSPRQSICVADIAHKLADVPIVPKEEHSLGERLFAALQAIGSTALNALLPFDDDENDSEDASEADALPPLRLVPRSRGGSKASPAILLEPARPGAHVRFLIQQRPRPVLPVPAIATLGSLFSSSNAAPNEEVDADEGYELCAELEF